MRLNSLKIHTVSKISGKNRHIRKIIFIFLCIFEEAIENKNTVLLSLFPPQCGVSEFQIQRFDVWKTLSGLFFSKYDRVTLICFWHHIPQATRER